MTKLRGWIVTATLATLGACGSPEQATVDQFFRAAQDDDAVTVASMAAVGPPGEIASWKVVEVTSRTTQPYDLPERLKEFKEAEAERNVGLEERKKYFTDHQDELEQIIPKLREDPEYQFKGKLGEVQKEWEELLEVRKEKEKEFQELKRVVDRETNIASKSIVRQIPVGTLKGEVAVTEVLCNLKPPEGEEQPFKVTLRKYDLSEPGSDRLEPARWIIADIEGATPEARAMAEAAARKNEPVPAAASSQPEAEMTQVAAKPAPAAAPAAAAPREAPAPKESDYMPQELRGDAKIQILAPESKVVGNEVVSTIRVRNASKDWITRFTVTEHWYDQQGNAVGTGSATHQDRFMPGEVIEVQVHTRKGENFYQNQFEFTHANGKANATVVASLPDPL